MGYEREGEGEGCGFGGFGQNEDCEDRGEEPGELLRGGPPAPMVDGLRDDDSKECEGGKAFRAVQE